MSVEKAKLKLSLHLGCINYQNDLPELAPYDLVPGYRQKTLDEASW